MNAAPEQLARQTIDELLTAAGWAVQDYRAFNPAAARGIALREVPLNQGRCDYLLMVDRGAVGPIEAKKTNDIIAFDKKSGQTVWEVKTEVKQNGGCWGTPIIVKVNNQDQLIVGMPHQLKGFDPKTGKELWFCDGLTYLVYTSPLYANGIAVQMSGFGGSALAVKLGGTGDITKDRLWHHPRNIQRVGSGIIVGEHIYILEETGVPHCYELATGKEVWQVEKRPQGSSWSSMLHSDGKLYVLTKQGDTHVFAASTKYELLATNRLGETTNASIAPSDGELFIRTAKHLWCISE